MAKPTKNRTVTGPACLNYVDNAIGFVSTAKSINSSDVYKIGADTCTSFFSECGENASQIVDPNTENSYINYTRNIELVRFNHNDNRIVGLIIGENDDGSYKVAILGNDSVIWGQQNDDTIDGATQQTIIQTYPSSPVIDDRRYEYPAVLTYSRGGVSGAIAQIWNEWQGARDHFIEDPFDYDLVFEKKDDTAPRPAVFECTGKYSGSKVSDISNIHRFDLTHNKNNTLVLGCPIDEITTVTFNSHMFLYDTYSTIFDDWTGLLFDRMTDIYNIIRMQSEAKPGAIITEGNRLNLYSRPALELSGSYAGYEGKTHAFNFVPFNLILTRSESQALAYLNNGTLPTDAFLYPLDWQNLPRTDGTPASDDQDPDYKPPSGEDGDSGIDGTPTRDADPQITSNMLTNNNLYWLQAGQLESFITWFWQNAGEIIELDDLWDRIKGLYNDLASAIINIRYFPVDPYYIGGVSDTTNIVLSSIEMPITGIKKLNKTKLRKRTLGEISIPNKYNAFTDYSPYTSLMLYLPFHGWIDLDIDIFTGNKLQVRCVYDHISGTIQYGVYVISKGKEFLLNTVIAKMAVDIPITLQSKNDRDSAIFNNVTNAFGNLLGAGASAVTGNPIGLVMSTAGVASSGTQSAPLKVNGTVGETGAFFMPNKCAVYIKRPSYNRPKNYGSRVGFPSNKGGKLSEFSGFTTVYNPQITFSGNTNADNATIKPLQSEIDEIYTALEKGVIL